MRWRKSVKTRTKSSHTHTFVSFDDPFPSIRYYDACSHNIETTRNYSFHAQHEGESGDVDSTSSNRKQECEGDANQPTTSKNKKRKREDVDESGLPRHSTRPRVTHDYRQLNDPGLLNELVEIMHEEEKDSPITAAEAIYLAYNDLCLAPDDPLTLREAKASPDWPEWEKAIQVELNQLAEMKTWELVDVPHDRKPIANKWVFLKKFDKSGVLTKYKARLVAKGFAQIPGMDFNQTFTPVVHLETLQSIVAETVCKHWKLRQMDVKGAYLNGYLKEEVYMAQPDGFGDGTN